MTNQTPFLVSLQPALGDPSKDHGIEFTFHPKGDHTSPFDIGEWPDIRSELRREVRTRVTDLDEWSTYLTSDRFGERYAVDIGTVVLTDEGDVVQWNLHVTSTDDVDWTDA